MSTKDLVNAIIIGDALEIENAFQSTMAEKISARLDDYRQEVAQNMFTTESTEGEMKNRERMAQRADAERLAHGAMSRDEYNKKWKKGPYAQPSQRKRLPEEVELDEEQLDELSKATLASYIKKASGGVKGAAAHAYIAGGATGADEVSKKKSFDTAQKRLKGVRTAVDKLAKEEVEEILASEEFAQLDELSKTTLSSYVDKSYKDRQAKLGDSNVSKETSTKYKRDIDNREKGLDKAVKKLRKEDVEQLVVTTIESALYAIQDGRSVLDEQLDEAVSTSSKERYEWANKTKPKGHGQWMFSTVHPKEHDVEKHKDQTVSVTGNFGDAAKKAQAHFKEKGHKGEIHVLT